MTNWNTYKLEEVISDFIDYRGKTPPKVSSGIPLITAKVVKGGTINEPNEFVPEAIYDNWMTRGIPEYGDVLLTTEAPLGEVAQLNFKYKVVVGQRLITLRGKKNILDNTFLKYSLQTKDMQSRLEAVATGTTVIGIKSAELKKVEIDLPDLPTQRRIAEILSALDDKIELNRRMNHTLEQMAQTLFRQYFVDGFDRENLPEGWQEETLANQIDAARGLSYKGSGLCTKGEGIPMHNLNSIYEGGGYKYEGIKYYKGEFKERHEIKPWDIIVSNTEQGHKYLLIGFPSIVPQSFGNQGIFSQHLYRVRPKQNSYLTPQYIYYLIMTPSMRDQIIACTNGTTVNMLSLDGLEKPVFYMPPKGLIVKFSELVTPIWQKKEALHTENEKLITLRDTLLPKLMSGEIDVMQTKPEELHEPVLS